MLVLLLCAANAFACAALMTPPCSSTKGATIYSWGPAENHTENTSYQGSARRHWLGCFVRLRVEGKATRQ